MAVGLPNLPNLLPIAGVNCAGISAGIKFSGAKDLAIFQLTPGTTTSAVFTKNLFCAAPVDIAKKHLLETSPRYLVINSGNANAGTGQLGAQLALQSCRDVAQQFGCEPQHVLPFSTGVIGVPLPRDTINRALPAVAGALSQDNWADAAHAIMTTDTLAKGLSKQIVIGGETVTITGISKGSGMICPDMATMLAYIATDAGVSQDALDELVKRAADRSFNRITVDGDTSTNDACVLMATGQSNAAVIDRIDSAEFEILFAAIEEVFVYLAQAIIRDGEGATKFITINVVNGATETDCSQVAYAIAHSPLVKTAFFASDPNWGRILAAIGRSEVALDLSRLQLYLDEVCIVQAEGVAASYTEEQGQRVMDQEEITITVDLAMGDANFELWTSDLSYEYVRINADYRS